MEGKSRPREKLDVPSVAPLEQKLANLTRVRPAIGPAPRSAVLDKIASFLPQLAHENERLKEQMQTRPAADFDIEHVNEDEDAPYIEMDLACGILDLRDQAALLAAERALSGQGGPYGEDESSSSDDESSDESEDEDDSEEEGGNPIASSSGVEEARGTRGVDGERNGGATGIRPAVHVGAGEAATLTQAADQMDCDDAGDSLVAPGKGKAAGRGRRGRAGPGGLLPMAAATNPAALPDRRRKVAAKRSKMIEELP